MKSNKVFIGILLLCLGLFLSGYYLTQTSLKPQSELKPASSSTTPPSALPTTIHSASPSRVQETGNIIIISPSANSTISLPLVIKGWARVFENQFNYRVRDQEGTILSQGTASANTQNSQGFGNFTITITSLSQPKGSDGAFEVFDYSAQNGAEIDKVTIPIKFNSTMGTLIGVFWARNLQPSQLVCNRVYEIKRWVPKTITPAAAAIHELLKGPTQAEKLDGYYTNINQGVILQKLTIANATAYVDFNQKLEEDIGGSCKVATIRAQIAQTLLQFPTIKNVVISINNKTEDILQP